jgi:hypothetical protein
MTDLKDGIEIEPNISLDIPDEQKLTEKKDSSKSFQMSDIMEELSVPKEDYALDEDEEKTLLTNGNDDDIDDETSNDNKSEPSENAKKNAEIIGKALDRLGAFGLSLYAKEENSDFFRMKTSELKMLTEEMESTFEEAPDFKMPPYIGLLIVLPVIYMPIIKKAKELRKINIEQEKSKTKKSSPTQSNFQENFDLVKKRKQDKEKEFEDAKVISEKDEFDLKKDALLNADGICEYEECNNPKKKGNKFCSSSCSMKENNRKKKLNK